MSETMSNEILRIRIEELETRLNAVMDRMEAIENSVAGNTAQRRMFQEAVAGRAQKR